MARPEGRYRVTVFYEDQESTIELNKAELDAWIEDKAIVAGCKVGDFCSLADVIGGHIELNLRDEGIVL